MAEMFKTNSFAEHVIITLERYEKMKNEIDELNDTIDTLNDTVDELHETIETLRKEDELFFIDLSETKEPPHRRKLIVKLSEEKLVNYVEKLIDRKRRPESILSLNFILPIALEIQFIDKDKNITVLHSSRKDF